jgi:hypothetical protein
MHTSDVWSILDCHETATAVDHVVSTLMGMRTAPNLTAEQRDELGRLADHLYSCGSRAAVAFKLVTGVASSEFMG